jgi:hypothetical protein
LLDEHPKRPAAITAALLCTGVWHSNDRTDGEEQEDLLDCDEAMKIVVYVYI